MISSEASPDTDMVMVKFTLAHSGLDGHRVAVVGEFNGWDPGANPMHPEHGVYTATAELHPGRYRFRYLSEDGQWFNDDAADDYVVNEHGGLDSVLDLRPTSRCSPRGDLWDAIDTGTSHPTQDPEPAPPPVPKTDS